MPNKNIYRTSLSQYSSSRIIDLPKENSPTSGGIVSGNQYHSSLKDFCEFIYNYGPNTPDLQTPTGDLYIDGVNVGQYEYIRETSYYYNPSDSLGSSSENKILFIVAEDITIKGNGTILQPTNSTNAKNALVIYSAGSIDSNFSNAKIRNKASSNSFNGTIKIINGTVNNNQGSYSFAMNPRLSTNWNNASPGFFINSSSLSYSYGNFGLPTSANLTSSDGVLFGGNGTSGGTLSESNQSAQGSYGNIR